MPTTPQETRTRFDDDNDGRIDRIAFDNDGDGTADRIDHYTYDDDGARRVIRRDFDLDNDGTINRTAHLNAEGRWERVDLDADDDGNIDRSDHYTFAADGTRSLTRSESYSYDASGNRTRSEFDLDGDGTADRIDHYTYDDDGARRVTRSEFDLDGDGTADRIDHYTYDDDGARRVIRRDFDLDDDGTINRTAHLNAEGRWERVDLDADDDGNIDRSDHYTFAADGTRSLTRSESYSYDASGNRTRSEFDLDGDGTADRIDHYTYDDDGARRVTRSEFDVDGDGTADRIDHYTYDDDGARRVTRSEFDLDGDGTADRIDHYTYDDDGARRVIRRDFDLDNDGTINRTAHLNAEGRWERVDLDADDDGNIDRSDHYTFAADGARSLTRSESYSYDASGNRTRSEFDLDGDGTADRIDHYTYDDDGARRVIRRDFDLDNDGTINRTAHLNAEGRWERVDLDADDDGNIDRIDHYTFAADGARSLTRSESYSYDASGNRTRSEFDLDGDGTADRIDHYTYDDDGARRVTRSEFDLDGDGTADRIDHYTYDDDGARRVIRRDFDLDDDGTINRTAHLNAEGRWERVDLDADDDGNIDRSDHYTFAADGARSLTRSESYSYDASGNRTRSEFDLDGDGTADRIDHYTYDDDGARRVIRRDFDLDNDGTINRTAHLNAEGRWERVDLDADDDGNIDRSDHYTFAADGTRSLTRSESYSYDASGNRTRSEFDLDGDGTADRIDHYTYDDDGARRVTRSEFDVDGDGTADRIDHYTYDDDGARRVIRRDFDLDNDGTINRTAHLNAEGRWERVDLDADDDGNIDRSDHYTFAADGARSLTRSESYSYDASGNRTRSEFDLDGDGTADRIDHYTYDDDGARRVIRRDFDLDDDGTINRTAHLNAEGRWERVDLDADDDGNIDRSDHYTFAADGARSLTRSESYSYDASGNRTRSEFDLDGDGTADRIDHYTYDDDGARRVTRSEFDLDGDGTADRIDHYTYDDDGARRVTRSEFDLDGDGTADRIDHYTYDDDGARRVIRRDFDLDDDGTINRTAHLNAEGRWERVDLDADDDGNIDRSDHYTFAADGARSLTRTETYTYNSDGTLIRTNFDDDADGNIDRAALDTDGDGTADRSETYFYTNSRRTRTEFDDDADGNIDRVSVTENQIAAYEAAAADADGDPLSYSLSGTDAALFTIDANTGAVRFMAAPDFEAPGDADGDNVHDITVTASDGTNRTEQAVAITVTNENDNAPTFTSPATVRVAENQVAAYEAAATDADGDPLSYSLSGTDAGLFTIDANTGEVRFRAAPDFEAPGDADGDNVYDIIVTASDGANSTDQPVAITVTNENDNVPAFTSPATVSVAENQVAAYGAAAADADGDPLRYSLSGTDAALFTIDANTGEVRFMAAPDFEAPGDDDGDNVYNITVTASDGDNSANQNVAITVTNENDNVPAFTSPATVSVAENQVATYEAAAATDADGDSLRYSLSGTDAALFTIDANTGEVRFRAAPDFEAPGDADGDNVYDITVTASDGTNSANHNVAITVTNENDNAPTFTSPATVSVAENQVATYEAAAATDADGDSLSYSLSGTDAGLFTIDANTGEVRFRAAPDFEAPGDADRDNVHDITVTASDGTNSTNHNVAITVTNENDNVPAFTSPAAVSVAENQVATYEAAAAATDADGDPLSYSLSGTDAGLFTIDANTGEVRFRAAPDFEAPGDDDGDNVYDITVTASDGDNSANHNVAITVTNENDNVPTFTSPATASVAENQVAAYEAAATDADGGPLSYSLSGTDAALFTIDANTGDVRFRAAPDVEVPGDADRDNVHDITVTASDGTNSTNHNVAITVTNENDNVPTFTSPAAVSVAENQASAYEAAADADGDPLRYSLSGTDAGLFTIDADTGEVSFRAAPDFEVPGDDDRDNVYDITVTASDGDNSANHNVAITVTNENDNVPAFTSPATVSVAENQVATYEAAAAATDADGDPLSYSLSGTDAALFTIDADTGEVSFRAAPDFEMPGDDDGDNVYDIIVTASDGTNRTEQAVAITVTNENDNVPTFTSPATVSVAENQVAAYEAAAADADGDPLRYSLSGTDAALFTIDANTGEVRFMAAPDFEMPGDADRDNVYDITVTASDGDNSANHNVAITVTNENDNAPAFTSPATTSVAENQVAAYEAAATDADGDPPGYSLSGTDAGLFTIDANTGEVSFRAAPDFEAPGDDDGDNVYDIIVTASDGTNRTEQAVAITVTNENDNVPAFTSPAAVSVAENQVAAYEAAAADADGDHPPGYSLSGTDAALFTIDANTGEVRFRAAPDFEMPGDDDMDNVYDITVTASDGANSANHNVAITVTNENDNAPTFTSPATVSVAENQAAAYGAAATDADGDPLSYSLSGTDAALFTITPDTGEVRFRAAPDFEVPGDDDRDNVYDITVTASDGANSANHNVAITVTNENDNAPTFTSPATVSVAENQAAAYGAAATDADGDPLSYSLSGTDAALFTIDANTGEVRFRAAPDFEVPGDADRDNVYDITVTASDGTNRTEQAVAITVTNENDNAPTFTSPATVSVAENQVAAYEAAATDADGDPLSYSLSGTDAALFTIDANTGEVRFRAAPDFEAPGDDDGDNVYDITVTASDGTNSANHNVAITVTNENDNVPAFTSPATVSVAENQVAAYEAAAADADGDPLSYSLSGTDAGLFTIDANTGEVRFMAAPDFEMPGDDNMDNVYDITVTASDGTNSANHNVAITVTNENDNAPAFTSPATVSVAENQVAAYEAAATDADGDPLSYSLSGTDAALFTIDANTGEVSFMAAPDFEAPGDDDGDNVYDITVTASDGTNSANHNVAITVTNENDNAPTFTSPATVSVAENQVAAYEAAAADADGDPLRYSLSGTDAALFTIDANTGEVRFMAAPDFEMPGDADRDNVYDITVTASDGDNSANHNVAITVTNENDNVPAFTSPATVSVAENQVAAYEAAAADADGDSLRYSLSGTDAGLFTIDANTGEVSFRAAPDFEAPGDDDGDNVYDIIVTASDGTNRTEQAVAITVTNENDNVPAFTSPATVSVAENQVAAYEAAAADADGDPPGYSLSGTDAALFTIDANTGEVRFRAAPDFEMPGDDDGDNVYDITVTASDGDNSANHNVAITVTNENDNAPTFTSPATTSVAENQVAAYEAAATDADGDPLRYSLSGTDAALFTIDANTGEVRFMAAPDFEMPGDADRDNVYDITVTASDGDNSANHNVAITVTNENDNAPAFTSPATASVAENQVAAYEAAAADADGDPLSYSLSGTDAALFTIDANTGEVRFRAAPDFEAPGDDDGDNVYDIIVTASDGTNRTEQAVAITVTNENDNVPAFTSPATVSVAENQASAYGAAAADADGDPLSYSLSGTDAALFTIDANTGAVRFMAAPDFEAPGDADGDNVHDITVTASDGTNRTEQAVAITVTNENDNAPTFTSPATVSVAENQVAAYGAAATDADGDPPGYSLSGTDAALFTIDANTGEVRFMAAPDFEVPGDDDGDNVYDITVTASDGDNSANHNVAITVTNENDNVPAFTSPATVSVAENQVAAYEAAAADADGDSLSYSLSGTDAGLFTIDANTGAVRFRAAPDFEVPGDADRDNVYDITVTASDGTNRTEQAVAITVTNENDNAPTFTSPATVSVAENQVATYEAAAAATDADGDPLSYSLSGTDAALFTIDADTGEVSFRAAPDFEVPGDDDRDNVHDITVTASDGTNSTNHNVAITVTNENDNAPTFTSPATASVAENQIAAYGAAAADADGDPLRYSLSGTDAGLFTIDANTGEVRFRAAPDFEVPGDADRDNVYDITVTASDGTNRTEQAVAITVTNENDNVPTFTSPATASVAENQAAAYGAAATDADGDTLVYSLSGTDAALFTIDANTGEVSFMAAPDFEMPGDDDMDNVYDITVTASDGTNSRNHNVAITVTDEYELIPLSTLDGSNGFTLAGIDASDFSGISVSSAGDVNGDGYDDLIIGAPGAGPNGDSQAGETYIVYGGASPPGTDGVLDLSALDGTNGFILTGIDASDFSGISVSSAGDVNGDGYGDLIIGANRADGFAGETYLVYGGANAPGEDGVLDLGALNGTNGFILNGIDAGDFSGLSVSSAGDVNGDGYDDLIIGANGADPNGDSQAGETYLVYGGARAPGTGGELDLSTLDGTNGFILNGIDRGDRSGYSVSSAGDVNGDGYDDLIIGAPGAGSSGETYVVYGGVRAPGTGGVLDLSALNGTNGFILNGIDRGDRSGISVSSAGDVNGDGYDDLIIGAWYADPNGGSAAGETYIVYGGASAPGTNGVLDLSALDGTNGFILNGIDTYDLSGRSVSSAGDVNGDGYDDLIIGAGLADPNGDSSGETYIVYGGASAPGTDGVLDLSTLNSTNGFTLNGTDAGDRFGSSVSSAGDVNGDGYDDLIIGAIWADPNGDREAGETYIVYGGATGTESLVPVTASGTAAAAADNFTGNAGADSFTDIATNDVVRGGAGDDTISVTALDFAAIDGGTGQDRLILDGAGLSLDLTGAGHAGVDNVEVFDLSGTGSNTLVLDAQAVFDLTEERAGGVASLDVRGDADDRVDLTQSMGRPFVLAGQATEDGTTYNVYRDGNAQIRVEAGVQVQIPVSTLPTFTSPATVSVAENQAAAYEAAATDADGDPLRYSLSGTDAGLFTIDANTGEVSFRAAPDFEMPGDADRDNVYDITVTASDGTNSTNHNVAITVTNENDNVPAFTSPATVSVAENQVAAYGAAATDADGDPLSYSLSGTDAALFTIDANTGEVRFMAAPDFEAPGDDDRDNVYDITVTASDGDNSANHNVAITVTNENDNVPAFTSPATASVAENQVAAYEAAAADADGDPLSYSLSGTDAGLFTIDANTGEVRFRAAPDFEMPGDDDGDNVYDITVTASDGTNRTEQAVAITVTNENDNAPTFTSPATVSVAENQVAAYEAAATDADGDPLSYSLSGTDAALFTIDANTGEVRFRAAPDFEVPGDDDGDNVYDITVTASDGTNRTEQAVAITVTNENDNAPAFTSPATVSVAENQVAAYEAAAADADGDPLSYSLSGTDAALFTIIPDTGDVRFMAAPDFEAPGDDDRDNVYDITVTASDGDNSANHNVAITVTNENDNVPTFTSPATVSVAENQAAAYEAAATDADGDSLRYSLSGTDAALFTIDANTGEVRFMAAPDFEAPGDDDGDNVYDITVTASDGTNRTEQAVAITVTNENDNAPTFTSPATVSVAENQVAAYEAAATDADGDSLRYSLSGTDAALFTIDANTGEVRFMAAPDFEAPGDDDGDNVYDITVTASDGDNSANHNVAITVTNENDNAPTFTSPAAVSVAENQASAYGAAATDADGDPLSYSLSGTDAGLFMIDANTGEVRFRAAPDFEAPGDADRDNVHDITVTASDGANSANHNVAITVTNENDNAPTFTSPATVSVAENQVAAYGAAATDADGDPLRYSLSGTDAALFTIDADTGEVSFRAAPDFEVPGDDDGDNVYDITVTASDGTNSTNHNVAITVTNENDNAPAFTSPATVSVAENQVAAYEAAATDADGDPLRYSLSGTDAALFTIDANTGEVRFMAAPDFEMPGDADRDNVYDITVTASDGDNSANHNVAITVTNENDNAPAFTSPATASVAENQVAAYEAAAADADGDPLSYSLSGTDAALFTIDANTGEVRFRAAPDFEAPGDDDGDNVYDIIVTASDGTNRTEQAVAITVTNENDNAPAFTSPATASVAENQVAAYGAAATDADGDPLSYSLSGTDAALFTIDANTGEVSFRAAPDFEAPGDADRDNVYDITVTASDGTNSTNHNVAITVTNENDNVPAFTSPATVSVAENQVAAYEAAAADADGDPLRYSLSGTDAGLFTIDANTGEVRFRAAPDFEMPGDDDMDNVYDITVTASDGTNSRNHNVAITVTDEYELIPLSTLDGSNGFTLAGMDAFDQSGISVSSAGDVNGDGYDDLIIGANGADPNGDSQAGETYIVYGGASPPGTDGVLDLSALDGTNGFILTGIDASDFSGISVSSAGDVNGDGYGDLIIGANRADGFAGETYLVYGGANAPGEDGVLDLGALNGTNGFILNGIDASDYSGLSVSSAGDVNGDGYDDLIIGARDADPNGDSGAGETYVVYGGARAPGTGGVLDLSDLDGTNGFILNGIDRGDRSGTSVSSAGDVNGDGYDDLIIGANGAGISGETYVVYGGARAPGTGGVLDLSALNGTNGFILNGIDAGDSSGYSVSSAGDVNGDGYDDLIIGATYADPNGGGSGETYVVYGGASAPGTDGVLDLSDLDGTNGFTLAGIDTYDLSGSSVSSAGDVNGDGYDDLIIGAESADRAAGETYIVYGGASAPGTDGVLDLSTLNSTNGFTLNGTDAGDRFGSSVSSAGDVNGDGYDDLIIGAIWADPNGDFRAGETYIVYGGATGTESLVPVTAQGTAAAAGDNFTGNAGADSFTDIATNDVVRGGAGDDTISVTALDFAAIDGGTGQDRLILDGAGLSLDLTGAGHAGVDSVEVFDLSGTGGNTLVLDALAVFDLTEDRAGGVASLDVRGGADDRVDLTQSMGRPFVLAGQATEDGTTYNVYRDGNAQIRVEAGVQVQIPVSTLPTFTSPATVSVAENQVAAYEAAATDADGDPLSYSLSGTDAALFTIDADTGEVSFMAAPDFEMPGDDDRDNVYDIIVTASDGTNSTNHNVAITVTDEYDLVPLSTLDGSNGFTLNGIDARDLSGRSVSSAGDVNGDGYDDLIIGAYRADPTGETYLVYGGARAPGTGGVLDLGALDGTNGFTLTGIDADDYSGSSVSSAGDVNGDGYDDLIIGAQGADPNGDSNAGETYLVYGGASAPGTDGVLDLSDLDGTNGFTLAGIDTYDLSGWSVSSAGDVNGDGYDDLIIGAFGANPNGIVSGETHVVYGGASAPGTGGVLDLSDLNGTNGFTLNGIDAFDRSGYSVSSAGDVNGDGYDDLIIGTRSADPNGDSDAGETYVVYGGASAPGTGGRFNLSALDGTNGFILNGVDAGDESGRSVSSAGDVNGDGYDDLIIGARQADPGEDSSAGETYVVYGGASAPGTGGVLDLSDLDGSNGFILNGIDAYDSSGYSVSSAGDVNGDGYDDLIIGANGAGRDRDSRAGETYIVYGGASPPGTGGVLDLSTLNGTNGFILNGIDRSDRSGTSVSSAGDVNGDGYDDLIIGASGADPNGVSFAGETYIVYGGATGTESLVPVTASGTAAAADNFTGNAGADSFTDIATNDVVRGGAGDDTIRVTALDFAAIDGGTGTDQLILDGAGLSLDLTGAGHAGVDSVEILDLSGTGANSLVLDALAVFDLTEERAGGVASLDVLGDADDRVDLGGSSFALTGTVTEDGTTYNVYRDGNAQLRVEDGVSVTLAATPTGSMGTGTGFGAGANGDGDPERIGDRDASGLSVRLDEDTDGDGDTDRVTYEGDADFAGNFPNNIGLEVVRLDGLDGAGSTDLTIPDEFVFAGNGEPATPVRIEGGNTDTLRFDMDDFAEAPEPVGFGGESYRSFASDDQTWSFLVDADVMLIDI